jgi:iron complex transport system substrate-binding protein
VRLAGCVSGLLCFVLLVACGESGAPRLAVQSDAAAPRLVTLSPHLAELVYAIGAGDQLVGVTAYTDYPAETLSLPVIGDAFNLDLERLLLLAPDMLLAWDQGTPQHVIEQLREYGYQVEVITTTSIGDIGQALRRIGSLTAREAAAEQAATEFESAIDGLAAELASQPAIRVFYQVDARPLYTVSGAHYVSEVLALCGGENIFADVGGLAPSVSVEAVLERNPEAILASTDAGPQAFEQWQRWPALAANRYGNHFLIPANEIARATPRLLVAAEGVCDALRQARQNREAYRDD